MREMKDSGIEWIGKIPNDWKRPALKYVTDEITDFTASGSFADLAKNVKYLDFEDYAMLIRTVDLSAKRKISHIYVNKHAYNYLKKSNLHGGELILPNIGSVGAIYRYTPMYKKSTLAPNSIMIKSINNHYLYYLFNNSSGENALKRLSNATTQSKFNKIQLRNLKVILPTINEQNSIANFLDAKCADIDSLTADIQKQINILKEYKKSVITQAVTKGLDPNVEMKDSGIAWIGKIPKHWSVSKLKYLGRLQNGISKSHNFFGRGNPFITYGDVYNNDKLPLQGSGLIMSTLQEQRLYSIKRGDVFFTRTSETIEEIGFASTCIQNVDNATFAGFLIRFRPINECLLPEFSRYYFRSEIHRHFFVKEMNLVTRASLGQILLGKLPVLLPAIDEQHLIVDFLDAKCADIDAAIAGKQKQLDVLKEYKKSLIYEYVTGKKEVPCHE